MAWYCEGCQEEVDRDDVTNNLIHDACGKEVYEISDTNFAAWEQGLFTMQGVARLLGGGIYGLGGSFGKVLRKLRLLA